MKYFIDFEAMQFSNYIISVGCVREDGKEFYSLVHVPTGTKKTVSNFITNLTGLTTEMIAEAPMPEQVFSDLFDFCAEDESIPEFYCYGNCDTEFIKSTFKKVNNFKARTILGYMYADMIDFAPAVKVHFGLMRLIGLAKVYGYFTGEEIHQSHNSLEDARMLKEVYFYCKNESEADIDDSAFLEYKRITSDIISMEDERFDVLCCQKKDFNKDETTKFENLKEACQFLMNKSNMKNQQVDIKNVAKRIKKSYNTKKQYNEFYWSFEVK